jgi:hypothetical protein
MALCGVVGHYAVLYTTVADEPFATFFTLEFVTAISSGTFVIIQSATGCRNHVALKNAA